MRATLKSPEDGHEILLEEHNIVGRGAQASVRVIDSSVSREHASIQRHDSLFWVSDLKSANGTLVNGAAVNTRRALRNGDRIQFGARVLIFEHDETDGVENQDTGGISTASLPLKTMNATLLVGDLQNFAGIAAQLPPGEVADMLREWYDDCQQVLKSRGAIIDKFLGDAVVAYWPDVDPVTRVHATEAARMLSGPEAGKLPRRQSLLATRNIEILCHVGLYIGQVATGPLTRGVNTIVGGALRVAAAIEAHTRHFNVPLLAGDAFLEGWPEGRRLFESVGTHSLKGTRATVELFKLVDQPA